MVPYQITFLFHHFTFRKNLIFMKEINCHPTAAASIESFLLKQAMLVASAFQSNMILNQLQGLATEFINTCFALKQIDVSFSCICPVIDHEFHHNIVKVAVDPQDDSRVDLQTTLTML